jgi:hypothetical protein
MLQESLSLIRQVFHAPGIVLLTFTTVYTGFKSNWL